MKLWRQLQWRMVGTHMLVVVVGVTILLLTAQLLIARIIPADVQTRLAALPQGADPQLAAQLTQELLHTFQQAVLSALAVAGLASIVAGLVTSLLLSREILRPLRQIARSSQRIANGHYGERVAVPRTDELALMATHFNQMAEALAQIEQQRVALIGNVSHELRTPLSGLEGYLEGMMDGLFPKDDETLAQMYQEIRRLRRLLDDLQALSRVEAGQIALRPEKFELQPVVQRVVAQLKPQAQAQCLALVVEPAPPSLQVYADVDRVAQILINLVGNAIHYTPEGGQVTVQIQAKSYLAEVMVRDTGLGIPGEALPYVFERFYRVDPSRSRRSGGSGIGLTISRHLAWAMGGELTAASAGPGQGSTFTLSLPLAD